MEFKNSKLKVLKKDEKTVSSSDSKTQAAVKQNQVGMKQDNAAKTVKKTGNESRGKKSQAVVEQNQVGMKQDNTTKTVNKDVNEKLRGKDSQAAGEQNENEMKQNITAKNMKRNVKEKSKSRNDRKIKGQKLKFEKKSTRELSNLFVFEDISNNKEASSLIHDLIKYFTCNSTLPQPELDALHATLYDRIIFVFLYVLNCFIEKVFRKIQSDFQKQPQKNDISKKDVCCQTNIRGIDFQEELISKGFLNYCN